MNELSHHYKQMALVGYFRGLTVVKYEESIRQLIQESSSTTLLDFGCGAGDQYNSPHCLHDALGIKRADVALYDPSFETHDSKPAGQFDIVISSDVLEHIPEPQVDDFITELFGYAKKAVWASVCCRPAKKRFPGTDINLHVTLHPLPWWLAKFEAASRAAGGTLFRIVETP
jgi:hypothetical protein